MCKLEGFNVFLVAKALGSFLEKSENFVYFLFVKKSIFNNNIQEDEK
jgi:hypothetical protein